MRDGVKGPADLAGARVIGADMSGGRRQFLAHHASENEQIFVNHARRGSADRDFLWIPIQPFPKIHTAGFTETRDELTRPCIQRVKKMARRDVDAALPIRESTIAEFPHLSAFIRVEGPQQLS